MTSPVPVAAGDEGERGGAWAPTPLDVLYVEYERLHERISGESGPLADALREVVRMVENGEVYYHPHPEWTARETRLRDCASLREAITAALLPPHPAPPLVSRRDRP